MHAGVVTRVVPGLAARPLPVGGHGVQRVLLVARVGPGDAAARPAQQRLVVYALVVRRYRVRLDVRATRRVRAAAALVPRGADDLALDEGREGRHARAEDAHGVLGQVPEEDA